MSTLAEQSLRDLRLEEALAGLQQQVRERPADATLRVFLFQLLCVLGQWQRALTQLQLAGELDAGALAMVQTYREALRCEVFRGQVFAGNRLPLIFGDPGEWVALSLEALRLSAQGQYAQSKAFRERAFEIAPTSRGQIDGQPFEWIADADERLGPVLEAIINGRYYWVPFEHIKMIVLEAPEDLRDLVWMPAQFTWVNGGQMIGLIPTRYPGSHESEDSAIRLARKTEWVAREGGLYTGLGQRLFATEGGEYPLMDTRVIQIEGPEAGERAHG
ncbi:MAG: type VI secretion system accessory protein TagJ [Gammaproteobacteria bacterium]